MNTWVWIVIAAAIVVLATIVFLRVRTQQRKRDLRDWFGPEYARRDQSAHSRPRMEDQRADRAGRRHALSIRPLTPAARERYSAQWNQLQERFVERPRVVVLAADDLFTQLMRERGYPVDDFESNSELIAAEHPDVEQNYREAHSIYTKANIGEASPENLRRAVVAYRALFEELVANDAGPEAGR
jgi:hypothetical protein